jgi:hypothetical protein
MSGRRLILITDGLTVHEWQRRALETLPADDRITVFACTNTALKRRWAKHFLYYALNMVTVRNPLTRQVPLGDISGRLVSVTEFASEWDGNWQRLPVDIVKALNSSSAEVVLKFGMGLMRVPDGVTMPILSYHHGDPDHYRGRPAGYWEMSNSAPVVGQIIQSISNKLDAGEVLAFAETRVLRHSWRGTLIESFRHSPLLLNMAIENALAGRMIEKARNGKNYRLPSNAQVISHVLRTSWATLKRIAYGIFAEKYWRVATIASAGDALALAETPKGYSFLADPFFAPDGSLLVEALDAKNGLGALLHLNDQPAKISIANGHHSYPSMVEEDGKHYCIPEIANWSAPLIYPWDGAKLGEPTPLDIPDPTGLTDPSFVRYGGKLWLFANRKAEGSNVLRLWSTDSLFGRFTEHPQSPVRISPNGGRMAGNLLEQGGKLYRLGQNFESDYGDGITVFEIEQLDTTNYAERTIGKLRFTAAKGPHTFNLSPDSTKITFDWYRDRYTPMAGVRRLRSRLKI